MIIKSKLIKIDLSPFFGWRFNYEKIKTPIKVIHYFKTIVVQYETYALELYAVIILKDINLLKY